MTEDEAYKVHIQYTFNAFCKIVIRHAAIDKILKLRRRWEREVSLDYLMSMQSHVSPRISPIRMEQAKDRLIASFSRSSSQSSNAWNSVGASQISRLCTSGLGTVA